MSPLRRGTFTGRGAFMGRDNKSVEFEQQSERLDSSAGSRERHWQNETNQMVSVADDRVLEAMADLRASVTDMETCMDEIKSAILEVKLSFLELLDWNADLRIRLMDIQDFLDTTMKKLFRTRRARSAPCAPHAPLSGPHPGLPLSRSASTSDLLMSPHATSSVSGPLVSTRTDTLDDASTFRAPTAGIIPQTDASTDSEPTTPTSETEFSTPPPETREEALGRALWKAAGQGQGRAVRTLLRRGADLGYRGPDSTTPLHEAAAEGHLRAVRALVSAGAAVDATDPEAFTPLHYAAVNGREDCALVLLRAGAPMDATNTYGETPMHSAVIHNEPSVVRILLAAGADTKQKDARGKQPYDWAKTDEMRALFVHC